jgi:hypothetical protein
MGIVMLLFSLQLGTSQITPEYYGPFLESLTVVFSIFILVCAGSILFSATRGKVKRSMEK